MSDDSIMRDGLKPRRFSNLAKPLAEAVRFAYKLERQNKGKSIPWNGPEVGEEELAAAFTARRTLSAENLRYSDEAQGRDALDEIIGIAIRLGIEQGRRIVRSGTEYKLLKIVADNVLSFSYVTVKDALDKQDQGDEST